MHLNFVITITLHHSRRRSMNSLHYLFIFVYFFSFFVVTKNVAHVARPEKEEEHRWPSSLRWPFSVFSLLPHPIDGCHIGYTYTDRETKRNIIMVHLLLRRMLLP